MLIWLLILVTILHFCYFIKYFCKGDDFDKIPGPKGIFLLNNALDFLKDAASIFTYFSSMAINYKDICKVKILHMKLVILYNHEDVETVLSSTKYNDKGVLYQFLRPWLNDGLLLSDVNVKQSGLYALLNILPFCRRIRDVCIYIFKAVRFPLLSKIEESREKWHHRRKILTSAFHFNILRHFSTILVENSEKFVEDLRPETENPKTEIYSLISNMTLSSICETAMGTTLDKQEKANGKKYKDAISKLGLHITHRALRVWLHPRLIFNLTPAGRDQKKLLNETRSFRDHVIEQRRKSGVHKNLDKEIKDELENDYIENGKKRLAMLDLLLETEKQGKINQDGINEEVDTFMFEGHETTASALQYFFLLIANHPEVQDKIVDECRHIFGTSDRKPTMSDLSEMKYLECCIKETLRLYPPVFFIIRRCEQTLKLKDYVCPPGTECCIMIFNLHRQSDQFVEPLKFQPERFQKEPTWQPFAYLPFSAGPRNCIGQKFAMMQMKFAISAVLRAYRLLPVTKPEDVVFVLDIILRPSEPIYVKFEKR